MKPTYGRPVLKFPSSTFNGAPQGIGTRVFGLREVAVPAPVTASRSGMCQYALDGEIEAPHEFINLRLFDGAKRDEYIDALHVVAETAAKLHDEFENLTAEQKALVLAPDVRDSAVVRFQGAAHRSRQLISEAVALYTSATCLCTGRLPTGGTRRVVQEAEVSRASQLRKTLAKLQADFPDERVEGVVWSVATERDFPTVGTAVIESAVAKVPFPERELIRLHSWRLFSPAQLSSTNSGADTEEPQDLRESDLEDSSARTVIGYFDLPDAAFRIGDKFDKAHVTNDLLALGRPHHSPFGSVK